MSENYLRWLHRAVRTPLVWVEGICFITFIAALIFSWGALTYAGLVFGITFLLIGICGRGFDHEPLTAAQRLVSCAAGMVMTSVAVILIVSKL